MQSTASSSTQSSGQPEENRRSTDHLELEGTHKESVHRVQPLAPHRTAGNRNPMAGSSGSAGLCPLPSGGEP